MEGDSEVDSCTFVLYRSEDDRLPDSNYDGDTEGDGDHLHTWRKRFTHKRGSNKEIDEVHDEDENESACADDGEVEIDAFEMDGKVDRIVDDSDQSLTSHDDKSIYHKSDTQENEEIIYDSPQLSTSNEEQDDLTNISRQRSVTEEYSASEIEQISARSNVSEQSKECSRVPKHL